MRFFSNESNILEKTLCILVGRKIGQEICNSSQKGAVFTGWSVYFSYRSVWRSFPLEEPGADRGREARCERGGSSGTRLFPSLGVGLMSRDSECPTQQESPPPPPSF